MHSNDIHNFIHETEEYILKTGNIPLWVKKHITKQTKSVT